MNHKTKSNKTIVRIAFPLFLFDFYLTRTTAYESRTVVRSKKSGQSRQLWRSNARKRIALNRNIIFFR